MADRSNRANRVGQRIGDYRLLRKLGGGSFGDVYLGESLRTRTQVAVKVLQARLTQGDELKEFINEARTMRLHHPHIIPLLDFGIDRNDTPYLVMDYAPNGTLRNRHPKGTQVPLATVLTYVTPLASALQYAHDHHIIHRDVKPENMLLGAHYEVLLSDFGISTVAQSSHSITEPEVIGGTLPYMAPEQFQGLPRPASDQYALGIVVYEWLTGTRPFAGTIVEIAMQHHLKTPPPLREKVPTLSPDVEQVVLTALAKEPKERFASITAFADALQQASEIEIVSPSIDLPPLAFNTSPLPVITLPTPITESIEVRAPLNVENAEYAPANVPHLPTPLSLASNLPAQENTDPDSIVSPSASPSQTPLLRPISPSRPKRRVRRLALVLTSIAILLIVGSLGLTPLVTQIITNNAHAMATAQAIADDKTAIDAYNTAVNTNGIMFGFNAQHTHFNPFEHILNPTNVASLKTAWSSDPSSAPIEASPAIANGIVYVGSDDGKLYTYDANGCGNNKICHPLWTSDPTGNNTFSSPAVARGIVYISSANHKLYAYKVADCINRKSTCPPLWASYQTGNDIASSPAVVNGIVYVGSGQLYAYNANGCGTSQSTCPPLWSSDPANGIIFSSPAVANNIVYAGSEDGKLYAYNANGCGTSQSTCPPLWSSEQTSSTLYSSPTVANGVVYVGSDDGKLYAYNANGCGSNICSPLWTSDPTGGHTNHSSPAVVNGTVYIGSEDGKLYAYNAAGCGGPSTCPPLWTSKPTGGPIASSPTVANGVVYIGSEDRRIYTYNAADCGTGKSTCSPLWTSNATGGPIFSSSPAIFNGVVYIGSEDGRLYAFHL